MAKAVRDSEYWRETLGLASDLESGKPTNTPLSLGPVEVSPSIGPLQFPGSPTASEHAGHGRSDVAGLLNRGGVQALRRGATRGH